MGALEVHGYMRLLMLFLRELEIEIHFIVVCIVELSLGDMFLLGGITEVIAGL